MPKVQSPVGLSGFKPVACCTIIYKAITIIISGRLGKVISRLINSAQSAYMLRRKIVNNTFLTHELVRIYHRITRAPCCAMEVDLRKAYDLIQWNFYFFKRCYWICGSQIDL